MFLVSGVSKTQRPGIHKACFEVLVPANWHMQVDLVVSLVTTIHKQGHTVQDFSRTSAGTV